MLPQALNNAIDALGHLPGVGARTAERYAYYLFRSNPRISDDINADEKVSEFYRDPKRDRQTILVVEEPLDIYAIEQTKQFQGTYHVLGGAVSPIDGITPDQLHIKELLNRIMPDQVTEIIIATNPSVEGESTALLLQKMLHDQYPEVKVTRLARGLPLGIDLSYADQITLSAALENRTKL